MQRILGLRYRCKEWTRCSWNVCAIHIGPSLVYPAVDQVPHITIDYTATSDSYSTFVTAHFPPQQYATEVRESALHMLSWPRPCTNERTCDSQSCVGCSNSAGHIVYAPLVDDSLEETSGSALGKQLSLKVDSGVRIILHPDRDAM